MRRIAVLLAVSALALAVPATPSGAGAFSDDVYRARFVARDLTDQVHVIEAMVDDRSSGTMLVVSVRRKCESCRADVYARMLEPGEFTVRQNSLGPECQCFTARVETKFGGAPLVIDWAWDPEQGGGPSGDGFEWTAVTANNLMHLSCYGSGTHTSTPNVMGSEAPSEPRGAKEFPKKMPQPFEPEQTRFPRCYTEEP